MAAHGHVSTWISVPWIRPARGSQPVPPPAPFLDSTVVYKMYWASLLWMIDLLMYTTTVARTISRASRCRWRSPRRSRFCTLCTTNKSHIALLFLPLWKQATSHLLRMHCPSTRSKHQFVPCQRSLLVQESVFLCQKICKRGWNLGRNTLKHGVSQGEYVFIHARVLILACFHTLDVRI